MKREAFRILEDFHKTIQNHCHESSRRCWEYMVEMLARASGWETETGEAQHVADKMTDSQWQKVIEFVEAWHDEVRHAKANRTAFSEPIGELLEHVDGTNLHFDQYFTPMGVVRASNEMTFMGMEFPQNGYAYGLDPCCGTGRFALDALVHNDRLIMGSVDLDLWLQRAAKVNARILSRWTTLYEPTGPWNATLAGRARFVWGDSFVVDLEFPPNWALSWHWTPRHWKDDLWINGYAGSFNQWVDAGKPTRNFHRKTDKKGVQFDYSMRDIPKQARKGA